MFSYLFNQVTVKVLGHDATSKVAQISYIEEVVYMLINYKVGIKEPLIRV